MAILDEDITRIRRSWARSAMTRDLLGRLFYENLFRISPEVRSLFHSDMNAQGRKLMQTLNWIVDHLDKPDALVPAAQKLAQQHVGFGVTASAYPAVGEALIKTLETGLGDDFDSSDVMAWERTYATLSAIMIEAAYSP